MWSVGCILAELILNRPLYRGENEESMIEKITKSHKDNKRKLRGMFIGHNIDETELDLLFKLLNEQPIDRIGAKDAIMHYYFTKSEQNLLV
jgi:serine/threonine protein kinase